MPVMRCCALVRYIQPLICQLCGSHVRTRDCTYEWVCWSLPPPVVLAPCILHFVIAPPAYDTRCFDNVGRGASGIAGDAPLPARSSHLVATLAVFVFVLAFSSQGPARSLTMWQWVSGAGGC